MVNRGIDRSVLVQSSLFSEITMIWIMVMIIMIIMDYGSDISC